MIPSSELILNADGSIYHLALLPDEIGKTIITVGDPGRVKMVSQYFDEILVKREKREFFTHTGRYKGKKITVISTGIGTDNIDIVFNELDALVNVDLKNREVLPELTRLNFIRIGTSGSLRQEIPVDSFLISEYGIGLDNLLHFYKADHILEQEMAAALANHMSWSPFHSRPYAVKADQELLEVFRSEEMHLGVTTTNSGFYGPQGRQLRIQVNDPEQNDKLYHFEYQGHRITNLEMETAGIYGLAALMGHRSISLNCILANRESGTFSTRGKEKIDELIQYTLNKIAQSDLFDA